MREKQHIWHFMEKMPFYRVDEEMNTSEYRASMFLRVLVDLELADLLR